MELFRLAKSIDLMSRTAQFPRTELIQGESSRTWQDFYWFTGRGGPGRLGNAFN